MTAGFQFDLCKRNQLLESKGVQGATVTKTGTTIAGLVFKVRVKIVCLHDSAIAEPELRQILCRMELFWEQIPGPPLVPPLQTRTVKKFISLLQTFIAAELGQLQTLKM